MIHIAVLGYGTVGSGVVEVLRTNKESINKKAGETINLKYVLDLRDFPGTPVEDLITHDFNTILADDTVRVVVEVMGGIEPAYSFTKAALSKGKSVITSNKELVAKHGPELIDLAKSHSVNYLFEASVGGGIPIIRPLNQSLTADEITEIVGILNGTTNYILTKMAKEGEAYETALETAQALGYAERSPEADVEGHDACRKIAILSSLAFDMHVDYEDIYTEGITRINPLDMDYAKACNRDIKLLGLCKKVDHKVYALVAPFMLADDHPLAHVNDVFNAILVRGNVIGDVMFYGHGAGKLPTASAVVADVVDAVRHLNTNLMTFWSAEKMTLSGIDQMVNRMFIRVDTDFYAAALDKAKKHFGGIQVITVDETEEALGFITPPMTEADLNQAIMVYEKEASVIKIASKIRVM